MEIPWTLSQDFWVRVINFRLFNILITTYSQHSFSQGWCTTCSILWNIGSHFCLVLFKMTRTSEKLDMCMLIFISQKMKCLNLPIHTVRVIGSMTRERPTFITMRRTFTSLEHFPWEIHTILLFSSINLLYVVQIWFQKTKKERIRIRNKMTPLYE